jgi:hypothetical protein
MAESLSLLNRFTIQGTLADPKGIPDPNYSIPGTLNWMRALAILVKDEGINAASMKNRCALVTKGWHLVPHHDSVPLRGEQEGISLRNLRLEADPDAQFGHGRIV